MRRGRLLLVSCIALILALVSSPAMAAMDYYTYGGFDPAVIAFQNIARIFGDNTYHAFISAFAVLGFVFGSMMTYVKLATGEARSALSWLIPVMVGMGLYSAMFVPTDTLYVYDPVYNQNTAVGGLPVGVVYTAGLVNHIERFIVELFDTNAPLPGTNQLLYADHGGAVGFLAMQNSLGEYLQDTRYSMTMTKYVDDCVMFELTRPGTSLTLQLLLDPGSQGQSLLDVLALANSPANYSVSYITDPSVGATESCQQIYGELSGYYGNPANAQKALSNACGSTEFADFGRCQQLLADAFQTSFGTAVDPGTFVSNNTIADITAQTLLTAGGSTAAQYLAIMKQNQNGVSGGILAGVMNPRMIDAYVAYSILLVPLLVLFIPTPMWQKAIGLVISLMLWNMLLRTLDVITFHMWATDYQRAMTAMQNVGMGIEAYLRLPLAANKYLGNFATLRNSVFLLATIISGVMFRFGDSALSRIAAQSQAHTDGVAALASDRGAASREAASTLQNSHRAMMMASLAEGVHGFELMGRGMAAQEIGSAMTGAGKLDAFGGSTTSFAGGEQHISGVKESQAWGYAKGMSLEQSLAKGGTEAAGARATLEALGAFGNNASAQAYQNAYTATMSNSAGSSATKDMVKGWATRAGVSEQDSYKAFAAMDMANRTAIMQAWGGNAEGYAKFLEGSQHLTQGERDAVVKAAGTAGMDLREFAGNRTLIDKMKDVGMIQAIQSGEITEGDLSGMGRTGLLTDAGRMDQWQAVREMTGMGPREATAFVGAHSEMKSVAGYQEAERFAASRNKNFTDLMRSGARSFRMDLSAQEAKEWGLGGRAGAYTVAVGEDWKSVFVDEKSGRSFQRGAFGRTGTQIIEYDEHGKQVGKWTHSDYAYTHKDGSDLTHMNRNELVLSNGTVMNASTAFQAALSGKGGSSLVSTFTRADGVQREAQMWNYAASLSQGMKGLVSITGQDAHELSIIAASKAEVGAGVDFGKFFQASLSASMTTAASGKTTHTEQKDLVTIAYHAAADAADHVAEERGLKGAHKDAFVADTMERFTQEYVKTAQGDVNFGVAAVKNVLPGTPSSRTSHGRVGTRQFTDISSKASNQRNIIPPGPKGVPVAQSVTRITHGRGGVK